MDFGMADAAVKAALALGRKIEFVKAVTGITEQRRAELLAPLEAQRAKLLNGEGVQGALNLDDPPKGPKASK